jgi:CubicO group peptidase (beta-lactamase class C family)
MFLKILTRYPTNLILNHDTGLSNNRQAFFIKQSAKTLFIYIVLYSMRCTMKKAFIFFAGCILFATQVRAQGADRSSFIRDSLDIYVNRALTQWRVPGIAICVVKDGAVVLMKGYGTKELGLPERIDENTLFMIGENTESFTAIALAALEANKKISLNDRITKYLPGFKLENKLANEEVAINDLLTHRIGFKPNQGNFTFYNTTLSRQQVIKPAYPLRTKFAYINSAYMVAGEVIPKITGKPWDIYLKENLFAPLGMANTLALSQDLPLTLNRTVPHTIVEGRLTPIPYPQLDNLAAGLSISSSMSDMGKWAMALLNNGKVGSRQIIPEAAIKKTQALQDLAGVVNQPSVTPPDNERFGLGWFLKDYAGRRLVIRNGRVSGYLSSVTLVPQERLGIIILTNTDKNELYEALRWQILDAYFKLPYRNYSDEYLDKYKANDAKEQWTKRQLRDSVFRNFPPAQALANYTGRYVNEVYGSVNIARGETNTLEMRFEHHPKMFVKLEPLGGNRFYATFSEPIYGKAVFPFIFQNGRITAIRVKVSDVVEAGAYDFKKVD